MKVKTSIVFLAAGVVSLLALGRPNLADADWRSRQKNLDRAAARQTNNNRAELYRDRAEYRRDVGELERDKADLRRLYRSGASRGEVVRKRAEIRQDLGEIVQDRREIRDDFGALRRDPFVGVAGLLENKKPKHKFDDHDLFVDVDFPGYPDEARGTSLLRARGSGEMLKSLGDPQPRMEDYDGLLGIDRHIVLPQFS